MKNEYWAVADRYGNIWHWTISFLRYKSITMASEWMYGPEHPRKSAWARLKRESGCRVIKVKITEISND